MSLESMIRGLTGAGIEFVVIGGVAANLLGSARITNDLDICYNPATGNRRRLAVLLNDWNAYLRGVERGLPFTLDERALRDSAMLTLISDEGWIDVMDRVAGLGAWDRVAAGSLGVEWSDMRFRILSLDALIAAKRATGRRKDTEALLELEALREERRRMDRESS